MSATRPVLVSWIAVNNDPFERERGISEFRLVNGEKVPGPTLTLLFDEESSYRGHIEDVVFFFRVDSEGHALKEKRAIDETVAELKRKAPQLNVHLVEWPGTDSAVATRIGWGKVTVRRRWQRRNGKPGQSSGLSSAEAVVLPRTGDRPGYAATRRSYRWCNPPTLGNSTTSPMSGGCTGRETGLSLSNDKWVREP